MKIKELSESGLQLRISAKEYESNVKEIREKIRRSREAISEFQEYVREQKEAIGERNDIVKDLEILDRHVKPRGDITPLLMRDLEMSKRIQKQQESYIGLHQKSIKDCKKAILKQRKYIIENTRLLTVLEESHNETQLVAKRLAMENNISIETVFSIAKGYEEAATKMNNNQV